MLFLSVNQQLHKTETHWENFESLGKKYLTILNEPLQVKGKKKTFSLKTNYDKSRYEKRRNIFRFHNI